MISHNIYTRKKFGLDNRVWIAMIVTIILCLGLLSYRAFEKKAPAPIDFTIYTVEEHAGDQYLVGQTLIFKSNSQTEDVTWDFGDKSLKQKGSTVKHQFLTEGNYYVKAATDPANPKGKWVAIVKGIDTTNVLTGLEITGTSSTVAKRTETFTCTVAASTYEWSIVNLPGVKAGQTVTLVFPYPSKFIVQVILDHNPNKRFLREVSVEDSVEITTTIPETTIGPLIPTDETTTTTGQQELITPEMFKINIEKLVYEQIKCDDIEKYLCGKGSTKVVFNGKRNKLMNFVQACEELRGKKIRPAFLKGKRYIKIDNVALERGPDDCIQIIKIDYH